MQFFSMFAGSFHSAALYRRVRTTANFNMGYSLLLVLLCTLFVVCYYTIILHQALLVPHNGKPAVFDDVTRQIADQIPVMTFSQNKLATKDPVPTVIYVSGEAFGEQFEQLPLITIDTTGATTHLTMKTPVLITADDFIVKSDNQTKINPLSKFGDGGTTVINRAVAQEAAAATITAIHDNIIQFYVIFCGICWLFIAAFFYVLRILLVFALGLIGLLIGSMVKSPINFGAAVSLAAVSYTPIAVIDTLMFTVGGYPLQTITLLVGGIAALTMAILCSRDSGSIVT